MKQKRQTIRLKNKREQKALCQVRHAASLLRICKSLPTQIDTIVIGTWNCPNLDVIKSKEYFEAILASALSLSLLLSSHKAKKPAEFPWQHDPEYDTIDTHRIAEFSAKPYGALPPAFTFRNSDVAHAGETHLRFLRF